MKRAGANIVGRGLKLVREVKAGHRYEYYPLGRFVVIARGVCGNRPTFKGIYLLAWGQIQPIKAIRTVAMRRREKRILAEFDEEQRRKKESGLARRHAR